ncbi:MAG: glycoside hydrolase family 95 protein, partial [Coraliomargarita sp.]
MTPLPKLLLLANLCCALTAQPASPERIVWDNAAADDWQVAYPVGNGRLGALPFASFPQEKILINEETIWARNSPKQMPENYFQVLETIREFEQAGQYAEADRHFEESLEAIITPNSYQLLGWLDLEYLDTAPHKSTYRELDLRTGIAKSVYSLDDGSTITQEVFAVGADDVIVIHITADKAFALSVSMEGATIENGDLVKSAAGTGKDATRYVSRVRSLADNNAETDGDALKLENTKSVILYLSAATDYNRIQAGQNLADGWQPKAKQDLDAVTSKPFKTVRETAIAENQHYFDRMDVDFGTTDPSILALPTKERLQRIKDGKHDDPDLIATYFQLGRYLLIASSRPGSLPANLQGIWNPLEKARWSSDFHLNINLQMNYWLAETTNLSELHQPLFDLIRYLQAPGKEMAQRLGMEGWCMGHATDVWGHSRIMWRKAHWSGSFFNGQWLTFHILENYRFNRDATVLEENWDILTDSTRFVESWLIRDADSGKWVARPGCSPENSFTYLDQAGNTRKAALSSGTTFDQFMILQVFNEYVEAAAVLGKTNDLYVQKIKALIPEIYMPQIGDDGRLMEWRLPFGEKEPGHRHISHVLGAFPGNQINLDND